MPQTRAARRYAKALLDLAKGQAAEEQVGQELSNITSALADPAVAQVMTSQTLSAKARKDIVDELVASLSPHPLVGNFFRALAENDRLNALEDITDAYQILLERALGKTRAHIRSATALSEEELQLIVEAFSRLTKKTVIPTVDVDPGLLGGVVVTIEGQVYDASLKSQLRRMGEALAQQE
jgi:F-type H+-transporting ATPase subunit delta